MLRNLKYDIDDFYVYFVSKERYNRHHGIETTENDSDHLALEIDGVQIETTNGEMYNPPLYGTYCPRAHPSYIYRCIMMDTSKDFDISRFDDTDV